MQKELYIWIHSIYKTEGKYSGEILKCACDTLSHEATGEDLWIAVKRCNSHYRSHDNDNIMNVVHLDNNHAM